VYARNWGLTRAETLPDPLSFPSPSMHVCTSSTSLHFACNFASRSDSAITSTARIRALSNGHLTVAPLSPEFGSVSDSWNHWSPAGGRLIDWSTLAVALLLGLERTCKFPLGKRESGVPVYCTAGTQVRSLARQCHPALPPGQPAEFARQPQGWWQDGGRTVAPKPKFGTA
jgi:hypothetical protein